MISHVGIFAVFRRGRWSSRTSYPTRGMNSFTPNRAAVAQMLFTSGRVSVHVALNRSWYTLKFVSPTMSKTAPQRYLYCGGLFTYCRANHVLPKKYGSFPSV